MVKLRKNKPLDSLPDDQKHQIIKQSDEEVVDETSSLGAMPEEAEDIDEVVESVGIRSDDKGLHELDSLKDLEVNKKAE